MYHNKNYGGGFQEFCLSWDGRACPRSKISKKVELVDHLIL